ncbi:hypothetical protein COOONC_28346 [Cooperia oncophora]
MALDDCSLKYTDIQQATVNNACASGSSGLFLCKQIIESGNADVVLACGFEKMATGSLDTQAGNSDGRALSVDNHIQEQNENISRRLPGRTTFIRFITRNPNSQRSSALIR